MTCINKSIAAIAMLSTFFSPLTLANGDIKAGEAKSRVCAACHGADGIAVIDNYPSLRGQNEGYLILSMKAYKDKKRTGGMAGMMTGQVSRLSDQDIADLAAYYANMDESEN